MAVCRVEKNRNYTTMSNYHLRDRKRDIGELTHEALIGSGQWQTRTVGKILRSGVYTGDMVQGCTKAIDHRQVRVPAEEWTVVHDTHEAIVSRELFDKVQGILDATAREHTGKPVDAYSDNPLKGVVFCADCGRPLHRQRCRRKKTADKYIYYCLTNSRVAEGGCSGVFIYEDDLLASLMTVLVETMDTVLGQYKGLLHGNAPHQCRLCGRWYFHEKSDRTIYCDRVAPGETERTCREVGARAVFEKKIQDEEAWKIYKRAYKKYYARLMKGTMTQEAFRAWADEAVVERDKALRQLQRKNLSEIDMAEIFGVLRERLNRQ